MQRTRSRSIVKLSVQESDRGKVVKGWKSWPTSSLLLQMVATSTAHVRPFRPFAKKFSLWFQPGRRCWYIIMWVTICIRMQTRRVQNPPRPWDMDSSGREKHYFLWLNNYVITRSGEKLMVRVKVDCIYKFTHSRALCIEKSFLIQMNLPFHKPRLL